MLGAAEGGRSWQFLKRRSHEVCRIDEVFLSPLISPWRSRPGDSVGPALAARPLRSQPSGRAVLSPALSLQRPSQQQVPSLSAPAPSESSHEAAAGRSPSRSRAAAVPTTSAVTSSTEAMSPQSHPWGSESSSSSPCSCFDLFHESHVFVMASADGTMTRFPEVSGSRCPSPSGTTVRGSCGLTAWINTPPVTRLGSHSGSWAVGCRTDAVLVGPTALSPHLHPSECLADQAHRH